MRIDAWSVGNPADPTEGIPVTDFYVVDRVHAFDTHFPRHILCFDTNYAVHESSVTPPKMIDRRLKPTPPCRSSFSKTRSTYVPNARSSCFFPEV
jgi:hypothetical protein